MDFLKCALHNAETFRLLHDVFSGERRPMTERTLSGVYSKFETFCFIVTLWPKWRMKP